MSNLFIIGNGFDLAHGLKTTYKYFREFLIQMENEECKKIGEASILDNPKVLEGNNIKSCFEDFVIPIMINSFSDAINYYQLEDFSTGKTPMEQTEEITQFLNDADKIIQWIKHGAGQFYMRESNETKAIKRFITLLEEKYGRIDHNINENDTSAFWQTIEDEFGDNTVKFLQNANGEEKVPLWVTLRIFIKIIDAVEGENWQDLETSMGTYNFDMIFGFFSNFKYDDDLHNESVKKYIIDLYYNINMFFNVWIIYAEIEFEQSKIKNVSTLNLRPVLVKKGSGIELLIAIKNISRKKTFFSILLKRKYVKHHIAKRQFLNILKNARQNYFFSFNYTQTLEHIYNIPVNKICHIHGVVNGNIKELGLSDLIFGHGQEPSKTNVTDIVSTALNITKKPINQCILKNQYFFRKLDNVKNIYSYGFSFSEVDMPYIENIFKIIGDTSDITWFFNDYKIEEKRTLYETEIRKVGFNGKFDTFHID